MGKHLGKWLLLTLSVSTMGISSVRDASAAETDSYTIHQQIPTQKNIGLTEKQLEIKNVIESDAELKDIAWALDYSIPIDVQALRKSIDDYTYSDYFSSVQWISRDGAISLSIYPKAILTTSLPAGNLGYAHIGNSYNKLYARHQNDGNWYNSSGMSNQYICHAQWAGGYKTPWNLEPWRSDPGYAGTVAKACNP